MNLTPATLDGNKQITPVSAPTPLTAQINLEQNLSSSLNTLISRQSIYDSQRFAGDGLATRDAKTCSALNPTD